MPFEAGERLGRYRIIAPLGSGGMGEVYRAHDSRLDREVAIKLLKPTAGGDEAAALMAEARAVSALAHPHVCTLHEIDEVEGKTFLVMELVEGQTLAAVIGRRGLSADRVIRYAAQIAAALAHAHQRHVIHRDLKSANVMVTPEGRVKVLDFGIARRASPGFDETTRSIVSLDGAGVFAGTLPYMAPEVVQGARADARSDIWALGIVIYEALTGRRPFEGGSAFDLASAIVHAPAPELQADTPPGLRSIVRRCLRKEPSERYHSADEVAAALDAVSSDAPSVSNQHAQTAPWLSYAALALLVITLAALSWLAWGRGQDAVAIRSLAVLPFADLSPNPESEYLADGVTDAVITELGQLGSLRVISRTSSMRFRDSSKSMPEIARELGVDAVLEGSLVRDAGRVRVTARLIRAATESSLWTGSYDRELRDILALQRDFAQTVVRELRLSLTPAQASRLGREQQVNPEAVEAYLKGRYQWAKRTPASLRLSIELFQSAIRADPSYAAPHAGLANSYVLLGAAGWVAERASSEALAEAKAEAARALALDSRAPDAHTALGYAALWSWNLAESERAFARAIELNPSDATTRFWHAVRLAAEGRFEASIAEARQGQALDPVSPIVTAGVSWAYHLAGRHAEAEDYARRVLEIEPDFVIGLSRLGVAYKHQRDYDRAVATLQRAVSVSGRNPDALAQLGHAYALQGRAAEARKLLEELNALAKTRYVPAFDQMLIHAGLGERDEAFEWLQRGYEERYGPLVLLRVDPDFQSLRDDPRFESFVRKIGVAPAP